MELPGYTIIKNNNNVYLVPTSHTNDDAEVRLQRLTAAQIPIGYYDDRLSTYSSAERQKIYRDAEIWCENWSIIIRQNELKKKHADKMSRN